RRWRGSGSPRETGPLSAELGAKLGRPLRTPERPWRWRAGVRFAQPFGTARSSSGLGSPARLTKLTVSSRFPNETHRSCAERAGKNHVARRPLEPRCPRAPTTACRGASLVAVREGARQIGQNVAG